MHWRGIGKTTTGGHRDLLVMWLILDSCRTVCVLEKSPGGTHIRLICAKLLRIVEVRIIVVPKSARHFESGNDGLIGSYCF